MVSSKFIEYCKGQAKLDYLNRDYLDEDESARIKGLAIQAFSFVPYLDGLNNSDLRVFNYACCADRGFSGEMFNLRENTKFTTFFAGGGKNKLDDMLTKVLESSKSGPVAAIYTDRAYRLPILMLMNNGQIESYSKLIASSRFDALVGNIDFEFKQLENYSTKLLEGVSCGFDLEEKLIASLVEFKKLEKTNSTSLVKTENNSSNFEPIDTDKVMTAYIQSATSKLFEEKKVLVSIGTKMYEFPTNPIFSGGDICIDEIDFSSSFENCNDSLLEQIENYCLNNSNEVANVRVELDEDMELLSKPLSLNK